MAPEPQRASVEAEIRALIEDWAEATRAKDVEGVVRHYAAESVTFDLAPPLVSTAAETAGLQAWFDTWRGPLGYQVRDWRITAGDEAAFGHGLTRLTGTKVDGEEVDIWYRQTLCFRKSGGRWRIAHQHESVPFYMDGSYRAAIDLQP